MSDADDTGRLRWTMRVRCQWCDMHVTACDWLDERRATVCEFCGAVVCWPHDETDLGEWDDVTKVN